MSKILENLTDALADRYSLEREVGTGGMATVYLARDLKHNRPVALKVLRPELAAVLGGARFLTEITTTANLQHPHILPLFDSGEADGFLYYVMPFVEGETLRERLDREHQLPVAEAVSLAAAVASALDYAHRNEVIHRDIKPENILLHDGNPLVADFGIALAVSAAGGARMTETGLSLGTPHYMSPEQASADRDLDSRTDVYALACVLYEMLTGGPPHTGPTSQAILIRILTEEARSVTSERKSVPPNVGAAVAKGLERLPADRFESAAEFGRALEDEGFTYVTSGQSTGPHGSGSTHGGGAGPGNKHWLADVRFQVAIVALLIAAVLFSLDLLPGGDAVEAGRLAIPVTRFEVELGDVELPSDLALSPDGSALVFVSQVPGGVPQLYIRTSDDVAIRAIPETENASDPEFSPDGDWIAFVANHVELKRIPTQGGVPLTITSLQPVISAPSWTPDGSILFAGQDGIYKVELGRGEPVSVLATSLFSSRLPRMLPGGTTLLYNHQATTSTDPEIRWLNLTSGEVKALTPGRDARYIDAGYLIFATLDGSMVAAPFDPDRGEITGSSTPIMDGVAVEISTDEGEGFHFALAKTGTAVYATGRANSLDETLVTLDLKGNETPISGLLPGNYSAPRFDPTGRYLAFELEGSLWIRDLVLGSQDQLHESPSYNPVWSRDGSRIAYGYSSPSTSRSRIFIRDFDLGSPATALVESTKFVAASSWTPDDSRLLFTEFEGQDASGAEVWTTNTDPPGSREVFLRADGWDEGFASLSPDGRWAAYESDEDGSKAIYVMEFPEPSGRIRVSTGGGLGARWSTDGRRIFYRSGDTTKVANVRTAPSFEVLSDEALFNGPYTGIDPHPDGTQLVAIKRIDENGSAVDDHLYFVVNWLDGVLARLGVGR